MLVIKLSMQIDINGSLPRNAPVHFSHTLHSILDLGLYHTKSAKTWCWFFLMVLIQWFQPKIMSIHWHWQIILPKQCCIYWLEGCWILSISSGSSRGDWMGCSSYCQSKISSDSEFPENDREGEITVAIYDKGLDDISYQCRSLWRRKYGRTRGVLCQIL